MSNFVYIAASLDGFIATRDGGVDWLTAIPDPEGVDYGYSEFIARIDALLMGRGTFEKLLTFGTWPYEKPVFVLSSTLSALPAAVGERAKIVAGDLDTVVEDLRQRGYRNLWVDGGKLIQSFLRADRIDELIVTRVPILLGDGIPLFGPLDQPLDWTHLATETYTNGLVKSWFRRQR